MSRSRKKNPILKYAGDKSFKKIYNRSLRREQIDYDMLPQGNSYRKMNNSWNIYDCRDQCSWEDFPKDSYNDEKDAYRDWRGWYCNK